MHPDPLPRPGAVPEIDPPAPPPSEDLRGPVPGRPPAEPGPAGPGLPPHAPLVTDPVPAEPGSPPTDDDPDPAPERDDAPSITDPRDRGGTGAPVGRDTIREGRVGGVMGPPRGQGGQGQGG